MVGTGKVASDEYFVGANLLKMVNTSQTRVEVVHLCVQHGRPINAVCLVAFESFSISQFCLGDDDAIVFGRDLQGRQLLLVDVDHLLPEQ